MITYLLLFYREIIGRSFFAQIVFRGQNVIIAVNGIFTEKVSFIITVKKNISYSGLNFT